MKASLSRSLGDYGRSAYNFVVLGSQEGALALEAVRASDTPNTDWSIYRGEGVRVRVLQNSSVASCASSVLRDAERILGALQNLLAPEEKFDQEPVDLYLIDADTAVMGRGAPVTMRSEDAMTSETGKAIVLVVYPEAPGTPAVAPLTRRFIRCCFGPDAVCDPIIIEGITGLVAARTHLGPSLKETDRWVQAQLKAGKPVSLSVRLVGVTATAGAMVYTMPESSPPIHFDQAATSFVGFLVARYSSQALRTYLQTYDPARQDMAAREAFHQPLSVLETTWLNSLKPHNSSADALRSLLPRLLPLLRPFRSLQVEILFCLILAAACNVATPLVVKYFLKDFQDFFKQGHPSHADALFYFNQFVLRFVGALACIYALGALVSLRRTDSVNRLNQSVLNSLQIKMFAHLQRLPHSFYSKAKLGDLMTCLTSDLDNVQSALAQLTNKSLYQIFMLIGGGIGLLLTTGFSILTLMILLIVPLFALSYTGLRARNKAASREQRKQVGQTATMAQEYLSAHSVIKAFGMEQRVIASFGSRIQTQMRSKLRLAHLGALTDVSEDLATALAQVTILGLGGYLTLVHPRVGIHIEDLVASLLLVKYIIGPVASLSGIGQTIQQASGSMDRVNELFEEPTIVSDRPGVKILPPLSREIRLEEVTFGYEESLEILHNLSLAIPAGYHVAIVGPTGSGKSTLLNLLMRFWDPRCGRILFDGRDLRDGTLASLRSQIGLVFQDTFIFDTTVRENIAIGRPDATDTEIEAAAQAARLDKDIQEMADGYETVLGERGVRMSGGQRQRLGIARAILRDPKVLLLDEASSSLDAQTEAGILETISALRQGRTVISVTHRLSWAKEADRIFVLEGGRLVEEGTHQELIEAGGLYHKLYQEQIGQVSPAQAMSFH